MKMSRTLAPIDARIRMAAVGLVATVAATLVSECLIGAPSTKATTITFGCLVGMCLGAAITIMSAWQSLSLGRWRLALAIGAGLGLLGGLAGSAIGQWIYDAASTQGNASGGASVFSTEMRQRLDEAGAKAGEIEVGLLWENKNDLDLHVIDPHGEEIFFGNRLARSGGELDVDRNAGCSMNVTSTPVEHVVWPVGHAPAGDYRIYVHHFQNCSAKDPTPFRIELTGGGKHITFTGRTTFGDEPVFVHSFSWRDGNLTTDGSEESSPKTGGVVARILGWIVFGGLMGVAQGLTRRSTQTLRNAAMGGAIGGGLGAVGFVSIATFAGKMGLSDTLARLLGMGILGGAIGICMAIVERAFSAVLAIRSGKYEGREIILDKALIRIGRNDSLDVFLGADPQVAAHHANVRREASRFLIEGVDAVVSVNGNSTKSCPLADGDMIQIGNTRMVFRNRRSAQPKDVLHGATTPANQQPVSAKRAPPPPPPPPRRRSPST